MNLKWVFVIYEKVYCFQKCFSAEKQPNLVWNKSANANRLELKRHIIAAVNRSFAEGGDNKIVSVITKKRSKFVQIKKLFVHTIFAGQSKL